WNRATLRKILRNRKYVGDMPWNVRHTGKYHAYAGGLVTEVTKGPARRNGHADWVIQTQTHEPLIDRQLFEKVQRRLAENQKRTTPVAGGGDFRLTGLLVCGHCGHRLIGHTFAGRRYYQCGYYGHVGRHGCLGYCVRESALVDCIIGKLES